MSPAPASHEAPQDFESLLDAVLPAALKTALYLCRDRDDAEDLVQDAAIQAFRQFDKFEAGTNFKAWFLKVQHNCFLGRLRSDARRPQIVPVEDEETVDSLYLWEQTRGAKSFGGDPAANFLARLDGELIMDALGALAPEFRVCCTLFFVNEMGYEQIAQITETPLGTVRSRLHRGRRHLQKALWELAQERGLTGKEQAPAKGKNTGARPLAAVLMMLSLGAPLAPIAVGCNGNKDRGTPLALACSNLDYV